MLFEPLKLGNLTLKNRICMPAIHHCYTADGFINDRLLQYYKTRARGGAALITIGGCSVDLLGRSAMMIGLHDDQFIPGLRKLTAAIHAEGALASAQLHHGGRYAYSQVIGQKPIAPSPIASRLTREEPREMTQQDIKKVIEDFGSAAQRARQAGFDAVELICSAGYLLNQFLSPLTNRRTDQYGGSWENRCRFVLEVVNKVRERVGQGFTVLVRLSGNDFVPGSNTSREAALFAVELEKAGIDGINVTGGWHETRVPQITGDLPRGGFSYLARGIKSVVNIPVIASNRINDPQVAENIIRSGRADLVSMGRPLIADPELPIKAQAGRFQAIRRCIACNQGCMDMTRTGHSLQCTVNPLAGREAEITIEPAGYPKKVLVIGGGPAGMEAARLAARRGHRVTLWEKGASLGGQLPLAATPPGKKEFLTLLEYYKYALADAGVTVECGREATADAIKQFGADVVVIAAGSVPAAASFPVKGQPVLNARAVLAGTPVPGKKVVVIGGGAVGCETAITIAAEGTLTAEELKFLMENETESFDTLKTLLNRGCKDVTIVEMEKSVGRDIGVSTRWVVLKNIRRLGIKVLDQATVKEINGGGVLLEKDGEEKLLPADSVILATGAVPLNGLAETLKGQVPELHVIGDAVEPRKMIEAIREGFDLARRI